MIKAVFCWSYHFLSVSTNKYERKTLKYHAWKGNETAFTTGTFNKPTKLFPLQNEHSENTVSGNNFVLYGLGTTAADWDSLAYNPRFGIVVMCKRRLEKHLLKHVIGNGTEKMICR